MQLIGKATGRVCVLLIKTGGRLLGGTLYSVDFGTVSNRRYQKTTPTLSQVW